MQDEKGVESSASARKEEENGSVGERDSSQVVRVVIQQPEENSIVFSKDDKLAATVVVPRPLSPPPPPATTKKEYLQRCDSCHELCRICQQQTEEPLLELGCRCRGELAKAHQSCIDIWFRSRGSNKCEICQQVAANIPSPDSLPSSNYWVWRVDPGVSAGVRRRRGCFSPLWVAFAILIGGLLLDVLISVSLGVSALPVNIIIGVLIVLGLGTAFRLALECCHEWGLRRSIRSTETTVNPAV